MRDIQAAIEKVKRELEGSGQFELGASFERKFAIDGLNNLKIKSLVTPPECMCFRWEELLNLVVGLIAYQTNDAKVRVAEIMRGERWVAWSYIFT